jgi:sirohydrochlorin cobaltochelatase
MPPAIEQALESWLASGRQFIGQILIQAYAPKLFALCHRDDEERQELVIYHGPEEAAEIARYDDSGKYRSLKTAPNLRHGWRLELPDLSALRRALDYFYPGRLAMFFAFERKQLSGTPLRTTLMRQSGMYRVTAKITDDQADELIGRFCRSAGGDPGCLRTIMWKRDDAGTIPSTKLPPEKFDPSHDQVLWPGSAIPATTKRCIPLLCQEACNLLIAEAREVVKNS